MVDNKILVELKNVTLAFPKANLEVTSIRDVFVKKLSASARANDYKVVLNDINFQLRSGDRLGIIGENGGGKSSLCRCISGSYPLSVGSVSRHGDIRALFESSLSVYPELSGRENMSLLAEIFYDRKKHDIPQMLQESLRFSELEESIDLPVKTYSKGMQLRLTLSILSAVPTDILILDEVFDGADEFFRIKLSERIRKLISGSGAVIFISHQEEQVMNICTRVLVLKKGEIIYDGDPATAFKVYRESRNSIS